MSNYFRNFPTTQNDLTGTGNTINVTNILRRFSFRDYTKDNIDMFYDYDIRDGERPDTISAKVYGSSDHAWVVLIFNEIHDAIFDWPLFGKDFDNYIRGKYGSIGSATSTIHEYRWILNPDDIGYNNVTGVNENTADYAGKIIEKKYVVVDETTYNTLTASERETIYKYDWEEEQNLKRRRIRLLHPRYLQRAISEIKYIVRNNF